MHASDLAGAGIDDHMAVAAPEIAELTGGAWAPSGLSRYFSGVSLAEAEVGPGELYFALAPEHWTAAKLAALTGVGAGGMVVPRQAVLPDTPLPVLRVDDTREALRIVAEANRDRTTARRILITGTEGKTGLKIMLHHIISRQAPCHAVLNSANLHVPIWRSLASIRQSDRFAIVEISVAQPDRGWQRSAMVRPHLCVITNISPQHTVYHGGLDALIRNKAESVRSLEPGGACLINADNDYYPDLKDAIQRIRPVPVMAFGSGPGCEGRLLHADFEPARGGWRVVARVFGRSVNYFLPMVNSYAPLASVSALTLAAHLGLDLEQACADLASFHPYETAGRIVTLPVGEDAFTLFDHSHRGSLAGFRSAFDDLYRLAGPRRVRLVLGAIRDLAEHEKAAIHSELAGLIDPARTERIYTVGEEMRVLREAFPDKSLLGPHGDGQADIAAALFADIRPGDVVFVKGHHRVWLSVLVAAMEARFGAARSAEAAESTAAVAREPARARLIAGGDVMLARDMPGRLAAAGMASALADIRPWLAGADIALVNLECVVANRGDFFAKGEARPYFYRAPPRTIDALVEGGVTAVTMANNHAMDFGPEALAQQIDILARTGLAAAGAGADPEAAARPVYLSAGDKVIALIAFATDQASLAVRSGQAGIFQTALDRDAALRLRPAIEAAQAHADLVVVSPHWGANWRDQPGEDIRRLAWDIVDLGADAILGHSAHILQGVELYRGRPIVYDMGTLLFDRVGENRMRHTALFELEIGARGFTRLNIRPVELEPGRARPAGAEEGAATLGLIETLSRRLAAALPFESGDGVLSLALPDLPPGYPARTPSRVHERATVRPLPPDYDGAELVFAALPPDLDAGDAVDLGGGLAVLATRVPARVRRGYGFVTEVWFRYSDPGGRRWRASVMGLDAQGREAFRYRHPVSEGMWIPQRWQGDGVVCDRVVVRPPAGLAAGTYELCWNLVDADTGRLRKSESASPRVRDGWLHLGRIEVGTEVPAGIAGLGKEAIMPGSLIPSPSVGLWPIPRCARDRNVVASCALRAGPEGGREPAHPAPANPARGMPAAPPLIEKLTPSLDANIYLSAAHKLGLEIETLVRNPACCMLRGNGRLLLLRDQALGVNSTVARAFSHDKHLALTLFRDNGVPVPDWHSFRAADADAIVAYALAHRPVVIKPRTGSFNRGVCIDPQDEAEIRQAIAAIRALNGRHVQVEALIRGSDHRILFFRDEIVGVVKWRPPTAVGNGRDSLAELIAQKNRWRAGYGFPAIVVAPEVNVGLDAVIEAGRAVVLNPRTAFAAGGEPTRIAVARVHPDNAAMFARAWRCVQLEMGGIDFISPDIGRSYRDNGAAVNEVNSHPNIFEHCLADQHEDLAEAETILRRYFGLAGTAGAT